AAPGGPGRRRRPGADPFRDAVPGEDSRPDGDIILPPGRRGRVAGLLPVRERAAVRLVDRGVAWREGGAGVRGVAGGGAAGDASPGAEPVQRGGSDGAAAAVWSSGSLLIG